LRDFYDIDLRFVGNITKPDRTPFFASKNAISPLKKGSAEGSKTPLKKYGTQRAMRKERGQKSGRIVTLLTRLTGTSG
jgi:hypothetical protein